MAGGQEPGACAVPSTSVRSPQRLDIQGLRALCMIQVLLFHAWRVGSPIGVDAFIMISAFLMTSSFIRRSEAGRMPFFFERWVNTFKRLLPPLVVVVLATLAASFVILPPTRWKEMLTQSFASLTYWQNWRLVEVSADYYAGDHALASPLQHLWSMSMQGQVFLLWPLLMTVCVLVARHTGLRVRTVAFWAFMLLTLASLAWLLFLAPQDGSIYFDTRARIWEFSFGSALAVARPWIRLPQLATRILGWLGVAVLVFYGLVSIGTYPGPMAAVPMLAVSAVLLFPTGKERFGVSKVLSARPLVSLGNISYAVYLVHWPAFVLYLNAVDRASLSISEGVSLIVLSVVAAWALTRFVDDPMRNWDWANTSTQRKSTVVVASALIGLLPLTVVQVAVENARRAGLSLQAGVGSADHPGASALLENTEVEFTEQPVPNALTLDSEWGKFSEECSDVGAELFDNSDINASCRNTGDSNEAAARVLIAGDSHAEQIIAPQIEPLVNWADWSAELVVQGGCSWGMPDAYEGACAQRNADLLTYVDETDPEYVFLVVTASSPDSPEETLRPGVEDLIRYLTGKGIEVVGIRDNLRSDSNLYECSSERDSESPLGGCMLERANYFGSDDPGLSLSGIDGFHYIDMTDAYCTQDVCPTIVGNVYVYMDDNHISGTYSSTVAPFFSERVAAALGLS